MNIKSILKIGWLTVISTTVFIGCKPEPEVEKSVKYVSASDDFKINSFTSNLASGSAIDFTTDSMKFDASFNEEVSWEIVITGEADPTNHAVKTLRGTSATIDPTQVFWAGESDNIYFFKPGETLSIEVNILNSDEKVPFDGYSVGTTKSFNNANAIIALDFEYLSTEALLSDTSDVNIFFDTENKSEKLDESKFFTATHVANKNNELLPVAVQGNGMVYIRGADIVGEPSSFFIGGMNLNAVNFNLDEEKPLDEIYFNVYANSNGNQTTKLIILLEGIGGDQFRVERNITWTGWRLISAKLSDFVLATAGALGPGRIFPGALKKFNIEIHSGGGPGREAEVMLDFISFTYGGPFSQSK